MLRLGLGLAALVVVLDQLSKWAVAEGLFGIAFWALPHGALPMTAPLPVTGFFNLVTVWNTGVSFGMFNTGATAGALIFAAVALAIVTLLVMWLARAESRFQAVGFGLVIGGAVGNVIDRVRLGAVFDFLDVHAAGLHFWAFNVADSGITLGVAALLATALFTPKPSSK